MDALIMAAGRGSRLGAATDDRPKALVDLGGITPLELQIDVLIARGVRRIVVVTGYRRLDVVQAARRRAGARAVVEDVWNPFWPVSNVIGSAWMARERLADDVVYLHADTVFDASILDDVLGSDAMAALPIDFRPCEPEQMKARVDGDRILRLSKSLGPAETAGEFIGIGVFRRPAIAPIVAAIDAVMDGGAVDSYFEEALNLAIAGGLDVRAVATRERLWTEIDFEEDLDLARRIRHRLGDGRGT